MKHKRRWQRLAAGAKAGGAAGAKQRILTLLLALVLCVLAGGCGAAPASGGEAAEAGSFRLAEELRISYLGPAGTYTEEAAQFFFPAPAALLPEATVSAAMADLLEGRADYAVIPQENSLGGAVTNYVDALLAQKDVFVVGEVILPISQTLMGLPGASLEEIRLVCSHAQGLTQSSAWREEHLPRAEAREMDSTAAAAKYVAETGDPTVAAVAAPGAARLYGLEVLAENVQITDANKTRFYVLSAAETEAGRGTRAVFAAECEANRLDDIIVEIREAGLELVTLHDRPAGSSLGAYRYILEAEDPQGISAEQLNRLKELPELRYLGCFVSLEKRN